MATVDWERIQKLEYAKRCSNAELAAMYLNDEIAFEDYWEITESKGLT